MEASSVFRSSAAAINRNSYYSLQRFVAAAASVLSPLVVVVIAAGSSSSFRSHPAHSAAASSCFVPVRHPLRGLHRPPPPPRHRSSGFSSPRRRPCDGNPPVAPVPWGAKKGSSTSSSSFLVASGDDRLSTWPRRGRLLTSLWAKAGKEAIIRGKPDTGKEKEKKLKGRGKGRKRRGRGKTEGEDSNDSSLARTPREILDRIEAAVGGGNGGGDADPIVVVAPRGGRVYQYVMKAGVAEVTWKTGRGTDVRSGSEAESESESGSGSGLRAGMDDGGGGGGGGGGLDPRNVDEVLDYLVRLLPDRLDVARDVLTEHPRILRRSVGGQLEPTVEFLRGLYGEEMLVEALSRNPSLLLVSGIGYRGGRRDRDRDDDGSGGDVEAMERFLRFELSMTPGSVLSMKRTAPRLFQLSVERTVRPTLLFLSRILVEERKGVDGSSGGTVHETVSEDDGSTPAPIPSSLADLSDDVKGIMRRLVRNNPALLSLDVERNLAPTVDFLRNVCHLNGVGGGGLETLVRSCPSVLGLSVADNLRHTVQFLAEDVGLGAGVDGLGKCLRRHPQILALSVDNLREKVEFFRRIELGQLNQHVGPKLGGEGRAEEEEEEEEDATVATTGADNAMPPRNNSSSSVFSLAHRVAIGAPSAYSLSLRENIVPKVAALQNLWGEESLPRFLSEYPPILTLSLQGNIQPTISFFNRTGYISLDENGFTHCDETGKLRSSGGDCKAIIRPRYLAASLYNRLLPRWHYLHEVGICATATHSRGALPALHVLAGSNDSAFCKYFRIDAADYAQFREEAIPKLKFSSQFETWIKTGRPIDDLT